MNSNLKGAGYMVLAGILMVFAGSAHLLWSERGRATSVALA